MLGTTEWFGRKFANDLPVEMFPNVVARLRGTPVRLEELLRDQPRETLVHREGDKWSIQEQAGHLLDLEPLWAGRLDDFENGTETLRATDLQNRQTFEAKYNERDLGPILVAFRELRSKFVARLDRFDLAQIGRTALHPRLGTPMRVIDHAFFVAEHDDHHLARIWAMVKLQLPRRSNDQES